MTRGDPILVQEKFKYGRFNHKFMKKPTYKFRREDFIPVRGISRYLGRNEGLCDSVGYAQDLLLDIRTNGRILLLTLHNLGLFVATGTAVAKGIESFIN